MLLYCSFDYIDTCAHHDVFFASLGQNSGQWAFEAAGDCATAAGSGPAGPSGTAVRTSTERIHWLPGLVN